MVTVDELRLRKVKRWVKLAESTTTGKTWIVWKPSEVWAWTGWLVKPAAHKPAAIANFLNVFTAVSWLGGIRCRRPCRFHSPRKPALHLAWGNSYCAGRMGLLGPR
jgi:hypothetical protein